MRVSVPVFLFGLSGMYERYLPRLVWIISSLTSVNTLTLELYPCHPNVPDSQSTNSSIPLERLVLFLVLQWVRSRYKAPHACPWALALAPLSQISMSPTGRGPRMTPHKSD